MGSCDTEIVLRTIDEFLVELGTQSLIDGDKARDQLLDVRALVSVLGVEEVEEEASVS
jgi:hypothetical protein